MTERNPARRDLLALAALSGAALAATDGSAQAAPSVSSPGFAPQPLPFDPKLVTGLSEKLLTSHHDNNYVGAVKRLGAIRTEFGKLDLATAPVFAINGLKREELIAWNSMILHEVYFNGLAAAEPAARLMAGALGWDEDTIAREVDIYRRRVAAERESQEMPDDKAADVARTSAPDVLPGSPPVEPSRRGPESS